MEPTRLCGTEEPVLPRNYLDLSTRPHQIVHGVDCYRKAKNLESNRHVAIKQLHNVHDKDILKRLLREIRLLKHFQGYQNVRFD